MNNHGAPSMDPEEMPVGAADPIQQRYLLQLYVTGSTPHSSRAITNIRELCEKYLRGRYGLDVIDMSQFPALAKGVQIVAAPTLIKRLPLPLRRFIGDMSHTERLLIGLDIREFGELAASEKKT